MKTVKSNPRLDLSLVGATIIDAAQKPKLRFDVKGDWVEVERVSNRFAGLIQQVEDEGKYEARVIGCGPEVHNCKIGDYIVAMNVQDVTYAGDRHYLVRDTGGQIVAVVESIPEGGVS